MSTFAIGLLAYFGPSALVAVGLVAVAVRMWLAKRAKQKRLAQIAHDNAVCNQHEHEFAGSPTWEQLAADYPCPPRPEGEQQ